ncbi:uncharacterized protein LOC126755284 [Bactrocera neohumeralis]|uniref:uncharacterized protein LOC126755284 n=1 Tax=Bactrocera neohumeralis TaxID=98809 RepID=UPI002165BE11|nr:uncharacterized protein LOC126755284 [Bactrocera neohumeralis]
MKIIMQSSKPSSNYQLVPRETFVGGRNCGTPIHADRSFHRNYNLPAKVIPSKGYAYAYSGFEGIQKTHYEVLVNQSYARVTSYGGSVTINAGGGGTISNGEPLYIQVDRCTYANSLTVGKIHPSNGCLYKPVGGKVVRFH